MAEEEQQQEQQQQTTAVAECEAGEVALSELMEAGRFAELKELVEERGVSVDSVDCHGDTALHIACSKLQLNAVKYLLLQGADPNAQNELGSTPLHKLAASPLARNPDVADRTLEIAMLLVECDADPAAPNSTGVTAYTLSPPFTPLRQLLSDKCARREVAVEAKYLGTVIGHSGKTVGRIQRECGCSVEVNNSNRGDDNDNDNDNNNNTKKKDKINNGSNNNDDDDDGNGAAIVNVTLVGREENITRAANEIEKLVNSRKAQDELMAKRRLAEEAKRAEDDTATVLKIPTEKIGFLIGAKGKNISPICKELGVRITIEDPTDASSGSGEAVVAKDVPAGTTPVHIKGKEDAVYAAADRIMALLKGASLHRPQQHQHQQQRDNNKKKQQQHQEGKQQRRTIKVIPRFHVTGANAGTPTNVTNGGGAGGASSSLSPPPPPLPLADEFPSIESVDPKKAVADSEETPATAAPTKILRIVRKKEN